MGLIVARVPGAVAAVAEPYAVGTCRRVTILTALRG